eukprot:7516124-Ditylum_brightwellii.AAC.1
MLQRCLIGLPGLEDKVSIEGGREIAMAASKRPRSPGVLNGGTGSRGALLRLSSLTWILDLTRKKLMQLQRK